MSSLSTPGLKITLAQREYFRYTGISAERVRLGFGAARLEAAWARRRLDAQSPAGQAPNSHSRNS